MLTVDFAIAQGGTTATAVIPNGYRLHSLDVPTIDNATLAIAISIDGVAFRTPYDGTGSLGAIQGASTGDRLVVLPEAVSRATEGRSVRITAGAAQTTAAVTLRGQCVRTEA